MWPKARGRPESHTLVLAHQRTRSQDRAARARGTRRSSRARSSRDRGLPRGGPRLARHLWRTCFALFIAAGSFFSIRERVAKILPEPFATAPMRALPILLLFGAMFYWLWKVRRRRPLPVLIRYDSMPLATRAK